MNNVLDNRSFAEQIRIVIDISSIEGQTQGIKRLAELSKKGYEIKEVSTQDNEQNYFLEIKQGA